MHRARDFDLNAPLPPNAQDLVQDLELHTLFQAMAREDEFLLGVAKQAVLTGFGNDLDTLRYRQDILKDCLNNSTLVREMYAIAVQAIERERKHFWGITSNYPPSTLHRGREVMQMFVEMLRKFRGIADAHAAQFHSDGFTKLFTMLQRELDDAYFARVQTHLRALKFDDGILISAQLGDGNKGVNYVLRKPHNSEQNFFQRVFAPKSPAFTFYIADRDESGARALAELEGQGINLAANALAQSNDHILTFFKMLRVELGFYVSCLNLHARLAQKGEPICFPVPMALATRKHAFQDLYDVCLTLNMEPRVVGNDVNADEKNLVVITGANQGGKSTFLRSIGLAQLLMQCGMFVPAETFSANVCDALFTHYKREEDASMTSGKFDEELGRMSKMVEQLTPNCIVLFNESFAATNEREGSEIARQIVSALLERGIKIFYVTHLYEFARSMFDKHLPDALFLRAERQADGTRTFKLIQGEPLQTSFGKDLYERIFERENPLAVVTNGRE